MTFVFSLIGAIVMSCCTTPVYFVDRVILPRPSASACRIGRDAKPSDDTDVGITTVVE